MPASQVSLAKIKSLERENELSLTINQSLANSCKTFTEESSFYYIYYSKTHKGKLNGGE